MKDRQIDVLIAERVMGLEVIYRPAEDYVMADGLVATAPELWRIPSGGLPAYSTDIKAAWQVVEHFRAQEHDVSLHTTVSGDWVCRIAGVWRSEVGKAQKATTAICIAALRAVGVEVSE